MFYNLFKSPAIIKTGANILNSIDELLRSSHLYFPNKILVTQSYLYDLYADTLTQNQFSKVIFVKGGVVDEFEYLESQIKDEDAIILAFGGGSVIDIVKYTASRCNIPYISIPSALSNDAVYSCVSRLSVNGKKRSFGVQPPVGIIVDLNVVKQSPRKLLLAGVADIVSNLSALTDWRLAHKDINEPINELAYMLSKESVIPLLKYRGKDAVTSDDFLYDLTNSIVTSGLSMIIAGNTRVTSGAEHLISHAIDEYFPEKSSIHGLQVGWAHLIIERDIRKNEDTYRELSDFYESIGLKEAISDNIPWTDAELFDLIPYAKKIRNRYTIFSKMA